MLSQGRGRPLPSGIITDVVLRQALLAESPDGRVKQAAMAQHGAVSHPNQRTRYVRLTDANRTHEPKLREAHYAQQARHWPDDGLVRSSCRR